MVHAPRLSIPQPDGSFRRTRQVTLRPRRFVADAFVAQLPGIRRGVALGDAVTL